MQIEEDYFVKCKKFIKTNNELIIKMWQRNWKLQHKL